MSCAALQLPGWRATALVHREIKVEREEEEAEETGEEKTARTRAKSQR